MCNRPKPRPAEVKDMTDRQFRAALRLMKWAARKPGTHFGWVFLHLEHRFGWPEAERVMRAYNDEIKRGNR